MRDSEIVPVIQRIRRQGKALKLSWLDQMSQAGRDPFKVLISCILSLRTQDRTTGDASRRLFERAATPRALASMNVRAIQRMIYPVGFYNVKAKTIKHLSEDIVNDCGGRVPDTIEELLKLKGVGRKTANLVVTLGWGKPGICVDTHVHRITNRLGYVTTKTPDETEFALRKKLPRRYWKEINGLLVSMVRVFVNPFHRYAVNAPSLIIEKSKRHQEPISPLYKINACLRSSETPYDV